MTFLRLRGQARAAGAADAAVRAPGGAPAAPRVAAGGRQHRVRGHDELQDAGDLAGSWAPGAALRELPWHARHLSSRSGFAAPREVPVPRQGGDPAARPVGDLLAKPRPDARVA